MKTIQNQIDREVANGLLQVVKELKQSAEEVNKVAVDKYLVVYNSHKLGNQLSGVDSKLNFLFEEEVFNTIS